MLVRREQPSIMVKMMLAATVEGMIEVKPLI